MAESAVSLVVDKLLPLLTQEVKLLKGVHDELVGVKDELKVIRAFLKDADSKAEKEDIGGSVKALVNQIREEAYRIEDVIDDYVLHVARRPDYRCHLLCRIASLIKTCISRHEIASEIKDIKSSLLDINDRVKRYNFIPSNQGASSSNAGRGLMDHHRLSSLFIEEAELVGIESRRDELIRYLVSGDSQRKVIAVVGMGGVGKTTLAKKVYDNHRVKEHFRYHAWITVSQSYHTTELLRSMLKGFYKAINEPFPDKKMDKDEELIEEIKEKLRQDRYLVVFDDVWEIGFWGIVELALLDHGNGSRILVTTRKKDVADFSRGFSLVHVYHIEPLPQKEAWELFCSKVFGFEFKGQCPNDLEGLSQDIVRRCGGLPLAIVAVGGLLATKKSVQEWQKVLSGLRGSAMTSDPCINTVTSILSLSYGDLPYRHKSCFLYFGMFPEDFSIKRRRIIQLWVANGLVEERSDMTPEEVGEEYFMDLIDRSLVQKDEVSVKGVPKTCRVHDMVREVILSKSEKLSLCHVSSSCSTFEGIARHLSISNRGSNPPKRSTRSQTRSIMVFDKEMLQKATVRVIFTKFKLLTSLDFEDCPIDHLPKELGNLLHLRYLNLRNTDVKELPRSIGKLHNLESLDLRFSLVKELPVEISDFPKLQHLLAHGGYATGLKIKGSFEHLEFLQTLFTIKVDDDVSLLNDGLQVLTKMRKFGICNLKREQGRYLCTVLEKMTCLRSLLVYTVNHRVEIFDLEFISSPPIQLQSLWLGGQLDRLPNWISKLHNLSKLILSYSNLMDESVEVLQALPNLKSLVLFGAFNGERLHFEGGGFQKLKYLYLAGLYYLNEMLIDEGALPLLERLEMGSCPMLMEVPSGLQNLRYLEVLSFAGMTEEFNQRWSQQESKISRHIRIHRSDGTYNPDDKASFEAWEKRKFGSWEKHMFG
ncbi:hypothetical protein POTOM_020499 [Populus tomentosa]|uniref:Uncharacterized protein n=1 Tax=Populus tomentosa TaxID=118781 RepID=A0A8X7ZVS6_POPTO|nr:hypothetical protein POTOM_020499 [Populus tomentosa]